MARKMIALACCLTGFLATTTPLWALPSSSGHKENVVRIEVGGNYDSYSVQDLKRRIWQLELAVEQLQRVVFTNTDGGRVQDKVEPYTCYITTFGKTYSETASTETQAKAALLKKCTAAHHAVHCPESEIKCGR